jgi:hypothetical protein
MASSAAAADQIQQLKGQSRYKSGHQDRMKNVPDKSHTPQSGTSDATDVAILSMKVVACVRRKMSRADGAARKVTMHASVVQRYCSLRMTMMLKKTKKS